MTSRTSPLDYEALGAYIEHLRGTFPYNLSQQALANEAGLSAGYLSEIVSGKKRPSLETIDKIARVFNLRAADVLAKAGWTSNPALTWECDVLVRVVCREGELTLIKVSQP